MDRKQFKGDLESLRESEGIWWKMVYLDLRKNYESYGEKLNGKILGNKKIYNFCINTFFT